MQLAYRGEAAPEYFFAHFWPSVSCADRLLVPRCLHALSRFRSNGKFSQSGSYRGEP
jgi:hypothetical protein